MLPDINQQKVFYTNNPVELVNFDQDLKVPDRVDWTKGAFSQYEKNSAFGILTPPSPPLYTFKKN